MQRTVRSVLFLAPYFPPIGGAGVQRNVQLVRYLPERGYLPTVVTGPGAPAYRWTPADGSLENAEWRARVIRLPAPEPAHGARWAGRAERWLRVPTRWQRWWATEILAAAAELAGEIDLVHASLRPYSTAQAALDVARMLGTPLVVDLEDPWALDEMMVYPTELHRRLERRRMSRLLAEADAVVMNTLEAARHVVERLPQVRATAVRAVPNAFDPADFEALPPGGDGRRFRIVHTGSLHFEQGSRHRGVSFLRRAVGGYVDGVDFLPRSHVFLVEAIQLVLDRQPELRDAIQVQFAGVLTPEERVALEALPYVEVLGFLSHDRTIALVRSADLLFLPMHDLPAGRRATIVPHKTYEYVASGRPILAAVPEGDARDLLTAAGTARLCRPTDVEALARLLENEIDRWRRGEEPPPSHPAVVARCAAPRLADDIADVFEELLARRGRY